MFGKNRKSKTKVCNEMREVNVCSTRRVARSRGQKQFGGLFEQAKGKQIKEYEKQNPMDLWGKKKTLSSSMYIYEIRF